MLDKTGALSLLRKYRSSRCGVVLALHRVLPVAAAKESYEPAVTVTETMFEELLLLLLEECRPVSLAKLLNEPADCEGRQRVALTFDDGWRDTFSCAFPVLLRHAVPATVFLCPGLMRDRETIPEERFARIWKWCEAHGQREYLLRDLSEWGLPGEDAKDCRTWSRLTKRLASEAKRLMLTHLEGSYGVPECEDRRMLTWDEVRVMRQHDVTFGSHTQQHSTLTAEQASALTDQLVESRRAIEGELGEKIRWLAYPNGAYNPIVMDAARRAGYSHGFTTERGGVRRSTGAMTIPRINIDGASIGGSDGLLDGPRTRFHLQRYLGLAILLAGAAIGGMLAT